MSEEKTLESVFKETQSRMTKSVEVFRSELSKIRTGRASSALVEHIKVDYYGAQTPLGQLANISVPEPRMIVIQPWDPKSIGSIERAIRQSDLGVNPTNDGSVIRITIPHLTEERRRELVKQIGKMAEEYRVAIRQIRKDSNNLLKEIEKEKKMSEDEVKKASTKVQKITDEYIDKINKVLEAKEKEITEF